MEMEMDKFLAKKQQIVHSLHTQGTPHDTKLSILTSIVHITLKSLYETVRLHTFTLYGYQQIQTDAYFLFIFLTQLLPLEESQQK